MIKAIVFDMGGVLLPEKIEAVSQMVSKKMGFDWSIFEEVKNKYTHDLCIGKVRVDEFISVFKKESGVKETVEQIMAVWEETYWEILVPNNELLSFIKELRKKYKVALLSNIYDFTAAFLRKRKGLFDLFEPCILSCDVGLVKPDKAIYELTLKKLSLKPEECIFIDDKEKNIVAAKECGMNGILFKNNKKLFTDLKKLGVVLK